MMEIGGGGGVGRRGREREGDGEGRGGSIESSVFSWSKVNL